MAFQIYNWSEVSVSLNQGLVTAGIATPTSDVSTQQGSQNIFSYFSPSDSIATISASNYFNNTYPNSVIFSVQVGDMIFVEGSDYNTILEVTTVTLPAAGASGTINTSTWLPSSLVQYKTTTALTAAQILALYATPVSLVPAQGAGTMICVDQIVIDVTYGTTQFASGGAISAQYGSTVHAGGVICTETIAASLLNGFAANGVLFAAGSGNGGVSSAVLNTAVYLSNATGAFTTGDSTASVTTFYRVLSGLS